MQVRIMHFFFKSLFSSDCMMGWLYYLSFVTVYIIELGRHTNIDSLSIELFMNIFIYPRCSYYREKYTENFYLLSLFLVLSKRYAQFLTHSTKELDHSRTTINCHWKLLTYNVMCRKHRFAAALMKTGQWSKRYYTLYKWKPVLFNVLCGNWFLVLKKT